MQLLLLNVSNNQLKFLPESIGSCYSLEELQANGKVLCFKELFNICFSFFLISVLNFMLQIDNQSWRNEKEKK